MSNLSSLKLIVGTASLVFAVSQNAIAASTMVTDAVGTQELWAFQDVLGAQKLTSKINQVDGKGITQTWDANGNMLRVTSYAYNATNQRTSMTEASGTPEARTTSYEYVNADIDLLTKTISPSIYGNNSKEVINTYDTSQNITAVTINGFDAQGGVVSRVTTFSHDSFGKVTSINGPRTDVNDITTLEYYNCNTGAECGQLKTVTNALGHESSYDEYDAVSRLTKSTDPNGVVTTYQYHPRGWLLSMTQTPPVGAARITTYEYDNVGQLSKVTLPDNSEQNYVYDAAHDLREVSDNLGNKVEYTYDAKGNRTHTLIKDPSGTLVISTITSYNHRNFIESINNAGSVTQLLNDAVGNLSTQTDPNNNPSTSNSYDALDRLNNTVDALSNNSTYQYDVADQLEQVTSPNGSVTQYEYDDLGNQTNEISQDRGTLNYTHDDAGNVLTMTDARNVTATYQYDALNRLVSIAYPNASENVSYVYDQGVDCGFAIGRLCQTDDAVGSHLNHYDPWGNVLSHAWQTDTSTLSLNYGYDELDRVIQIQYPSGLVIDYVRDEIGRVEAVHSPSGTRTEIIADQFGYRADGLITEYRLGNAQVVQKQYDLQGRLTQQNLDGVQLATYHYDANGNVINKSDGDYQRSYGYDVLDRLNSDDWLGGLISNDWQYTYDANGNRTSLQQDQMRAENVNYASASNVLVDVDNALVLSDLSGNITRLPRSTGVLELNYNQQNHLASVTRDGVVTDYGYNHQRQRQIKHQGVDVSQYLYDLTGRLVATLDDQGAVHEEYVYANQFDQAPIHHRLYEDTEDNTVEARQALAKSEALIADPVNSEGQCEGFERTEAERNNTNALFVNNAVDTIPVGDDVFDIPPPTRDISWFIPILMRYLEDSEPASDPIDITSNEYELDVTQIEIVVPTEPEADVLDYIVDVATTKRSLNNSPDIARHCIQEGQTSVDLNNLPLNGTNVYVRVWYKKLNGDWVYDDYELETEARTPNTRQVTRNYIVKDHLDTPRFIYDDEKVQTWRWASDGFGRQAANDDVNQDGYQTNFNLRFAGQYEDLESGLSYNWNRYYDSEIGRYVTSDPIGLDGGLNTYGYVLGNPLKYKDPTGEAVFLLALPFLSGSIGTGTLVAVGTVGTVGVLGVSCTQTAGCVDAVADALGGDNSMSSPNSDGGNASGSAPYSHYEENWALTLLPNPFGDNCEDMARAIKILRANIAWRETDLNSGSASFLGHKARIKILEKKLEQLETSYENICGGKCE